MCRKINVIVYIITTLVLFTLPHCSSMSTCQPDYRVNSSLYEFDVLGLFCNNASVLIHYDITALKSTQRHIVVINLMKTSTAGPRVVGWKINVKTTFSGDVTPRDGTEPDSLTFSVNDDLVYSCTLDFGFCYPTTTVAINTEPFSSQEAFSRPNSSQKILELSTSRATTLLPNTLVSPSRPNASDFSLWHLFWILPCVISLIALTLLVSHYRRFPTLLSKLKKNEPQKENKGQEEEKNMELSKFDISFSQKSEALLKKGRQQVKLFLVFSDDHLKHREVVVNFVKFLQADLGFIVFCELFQSQEVSVDPFHWMETCLKDADKVVVIWSPGTSIRLNQKDNEEKIENDFCTPILKRIRNDIFLDVNIGKYYFGYFDYCTKSCIPDAFCRSRLCHFKLMEQFDELYFRLKGIERYLPGGVIEEEKVKSNRYFDTNLNEYGAALKDSISAMSTFSEENPYWYKERNDTSLPFFEICTGNNENSKGLITTYQLEIVPPSPLPVRKPKTSLQNEREEGFIDNHHSNSLPQQGTVKEIQSRPISSQSSNMSNSEELHDEAPECLSSSTQQQPKSDNVITTMPKDQHWTEIETTSNSAIAVTPHVSTVHLPSRESGYSSMYSHNNNIQKTVTLPKETADFKARPTKDLGLSAYSSPSNGMKQSYNNQEHYTSFCDNSSVSPQKRVTPRKTHPESTRAVELAPLDTKADPMDSLMSLNMLSASKTESHDGLS